MARHDTSRPRDLQARLRLALLLWLSLAFIVWNDVFDAAVIRAGRDYLDQKALASQGKGADVTISGTMRPAVRRGAAMASLWALPIAAFGAGAVWFARREGRRGDPH